MGSGSGSSSRPASWSSERRPPISTIASGEPPVAVRRRDATDASTGTPVRSRSSSSTTGAGRPDSDSTGKPASAAAGRSRRRPKKTAIRSASSRRATNDSTASDPSSTRWASSTMTRTGRSCPAMPSNDSTARPSRNRSTGRASISPKAAPSARRCGSGSSAVAGQQRPQQLVERGIGQLLLRLAPAHPQDRAIRRRRADTVEQRRLPDARLALDDEHAAAPPASVLERLREPRVLFVPPEQRRHVGTITGRRGVPSTEASR